MVILKEALIRLFGHLTMENLQIKIDEMLLNAAYNVQDSVRRRTKRRNTRRK